jgi:hypothetical protein
MITDYVFYINRSLSLLWLLPLLQLFSLLIPVPLQVGNIFDMLPMVVIGCHGYSISVVTLMALVALQS